MVSELSSSSEMMMEMRAQALSKSTAAHEMDGKVFSRFDAIEKATES